MALPHAVITPARSSVSEAIEHPTNNPTDQDYAWTAPRLIGIGIVTLIGALIAIMTAATLIGQ